MLDEDGNDANGDGARNDSVDDWHSRVKNDGMIWVGKYGPGRMRSCKYPGDITNDCNDNGVRRLRPCARVPVVSHMHPSRQRARVHVGYTCAATEHG